MTRSALCSARPRIASGGEAANDTLIVADGFSCREQVRQETGRRSLHLAQVLARAYEAGEPEGKEGGR